MLETKPSNIPTQKLQNLFDLPHPKGSLIAGHAADFGRDPLGFLT